MDSDRIAIRNAVGRQFTGDDAVRSNNGILANTHASVNESPYANPAIISYRYTSTDCQRQSVSHVLVWVSVHSVNLDIMAYGTIQSDRDFRAFDSLYGAILTDVAAAPTNDLSISIELDARSVEFEGIVNLWISITIAFVDYTVSAL